jgi:hypothetical protein
MTKTFWRNAKNTFENKSEKENEVFVKDVEKLKSIFKKKILQENYKNIEPLKNIYDEKENISSADAHSQKEENNNTSNDVEKKQTGINDAIKEGFDVDLNHYTEKITNIFPREQINKVSSYFNSIDDYIVNTSFYNENMRPIFSYLLSFVQNNDETLEYDLQILENHLYIIFSFPLVVWMTYNWQFILTYKYTNDQNIVIRPAADDKRLNITFDNLFFPINEILTFIVGMSIKPLYYFDKFFLGDAFFPKVINLSPYLPNNVAKIIIIILIFLFIGNLNFFQIYASFLQGDESNAVDSILNTDSVLNNVLLIIASVIIFIHTALKLYEWIFVRLAPYVSNIGAVLIFIFVVIVIVAAYITVGLLSVKISTLIVLIYVWIHSLFGLLLYTNGDESSGSITKWFWTTPKENYHGIESKINEELNSLLQEECGEDGNWTKLFKETLYFYLVNIFSISFLSIIRAAFVETILQIHTDAVKILFGTMYVIFFATCWIYFLKKHTSLISETLLNLPYNVYIIITFCILQLFLYFCFNF